MRMGDYKLDVPVNYRRRYGDFAYPIFGYRMMVKISNVIIRNEERWIKLGCILNLPLYRGEGEIRL